MTEAGSELCALKMEVGPQTKEYRQPLEREKGKETSPPLRVSRAVNPADTLTSV